MSGDTTTALPSIRVEKTFDKAEVKRSITEANQLIWQRHCSNRFERILEGTLLATFVLVLVAWQHRRHARGARPALLKTGAGTRRVLQVDT